MGVGLSLMGLGFKVLPSGSLTTLRPPRRLIWIGTDRVSRPSLVLMGNEQAGLTDELATACDLTVKIPMRGRADSLNLAIATGIMVYAATEGT